MSELLHLNAELDAHLDAETADGKTNRHNGRSQKTVLTGTSKVTLDIPRDRAGTFDPQLIAKYQRRFPDFDEKIISMYARGMTVRAASSPIATLRQAIGPWPEACLRPRQHFVGWTAAGHPKGRSEAEEPCSGLTRCPPSSPYYILILFIIS